MSLEQRKSVIVRLGKLFRILANAEEWPGYDSGLSASEFDQWKETMLRAKSHNQWFALDEVKRAMNGWADALKEEKVAKWLGSVGQIGVDTPKTVALILAGNIPLVGLHDLLTVYVSGNKAKLKLSSDDTVLMTAVVNTLAVFDPEAKDNLLILDGKLEDFDAVIATGSDNTSRYFDYYFGKYPHIIRKNRTSIAVLDGTESKEDIGKLGHDIFGFFGRGCRSVTKIFVPQDYVLDRFFEGIFDFSHVGMHNKFANNYDYHKALWLLNQEALLDNNFLLLKEDKALKSPLGTLYYERYEDFAALEKQLVTQSDKLQCWVGKGGLPFGQAQSPELWDYADGLNTLDWLVREL